MQKTKKQLLGFAGLAAVGIMTAVAYAMPAAAAEDLPPSADGKAEVTLTVLNGVNDVRIISPSDMSTVTDPNVTVSYNYEETAKVEVYIEYKDANGATIRKKIDEFLPSDDQVYGTHSFNIDVTDFSDAGKDYKIIAVATDSYGGTKEDTVTFSYRATISTPSKDPAPNGDPQIDITVNDEIDKIVIQVYDKDGNPVFVDKDGKETPVILGRDDIDENGNILVQLPFEEYDLPSGEYEAVIVGYNKKGDVLSIDTIKINYIRKEPGTPEGPDVPGNPDVPETPPNTGFMIGGLNISRVDYLVTGLLVFGTVAGFALYLVHRKSRR